MAIHHTHPAAPPAPIWLITRLLPEVFVLVTLLLLAAFIGSPADMISQQVQATPNFSPHVMSRYAQRPEWAVWIPAPGQTPVPMGVHAIPLTESQLSKTSAPIPTERQ